ncbi:hypothetical protein BDK51DRAFT_27369 [Blyttiomyces helicus]|uniref:Galactose oxidase n=1 Tax=Blyttiomyces helicus TaxID=388810 RepID=A0A4P9WK64_9FUNG|nr:hypothetical protein BDK51DRAFT_27369 [Blyttiomyces helicus]|eukprot:RKO91948.1 hypothetical protein BDK51DRAFT_27369 [Blyttiomyces helicus]
MLLPFITTLANATTAAQTIPPPTAAARTIPPRFGAILATGPSGIVFLGGRIKVAGHNDSQTEQQQLQELQAGVVVVSYANQSVTTVNTTDPDNRLIAEGQACAQGTRGVIFGGDTAVNGIVNSVLYTFDLSPISMRQTAQVPSSRTRHCGTALGTDSLFIFGGDNAPDQTQGNLLRDAFIYSMTTEEWVPVGGTSLPPSARFGPSCTAIGQKVYLFGGWDGHSDLNDLWVFDNTTNAWTEVSTAGTPPSIRTYSSMTSVGSEFLVVSGGQTAFTATDPAFYFLNVSSSTWFLGSINGSLPYQPPVTPTGTATLPTASSSNTSSSSPSPGSQSTSGSSSKILPAVGGAIGSLIVILAVSYLIYRHYARRQEGLLTHVDFPTSLSPPTRPLPTDSIPRTPSPMPPASLPPQPPSLGDAHPESPSPRDPTPSPVLLKASSSVHVDEGAPPAYDSAVQEELRTREDAPPAVHFQKYRGLSLLMTLREVFTDRWARATNITDGTEGLLPLSCVDVGKDFPHIVA